MTGAVQPRLGTRLIREAALSDSLDRMGPAAALSRAAQADGFSFVITGQTV
jgi:hypothetical protein